MYKSVIIPLCITFTLFMVLIFINTPGNLSADNNINSEIKSPIPTNGLKVKSLRGDTYSVEYQINRWIKNNPEVHIYIIQSHHTFFGTRILYIWYK